MIGNGNVKNPGCRIKGVRSWKSNRTCANRAGGRKTRLTISTATDAIASNTGISWRTEKTSVGGTKVSKYGNRKTTVDGVTYDSAKEARRGMELMLLERAGLISDLNAQVKYTLIPAQKRDGKVVERAATYIADFVYKDKDGETVVEDVKSPATRTGVYKLKKKLLLWEYGLHIREV